MVDDLEHEIQRLKKQVGALLTHPVFSKVFQGGPLAIPKGGMLLGGRLVIGGTSTTPVEGQGLIWSEARKRFEPQTPVLKPHDHPLRPHAWTHMAHGNDEVHSFDTMTVYDFILMRKGHEEDDGQGYQYEITAPSVPTTQVPQGGGYVARDIPMFRLESDESTDPQRIQAFLQPMQSHSGPLGFVHLKSDQALDSPKYADVGVWGFVAAPSGAVGSMGLYSEAGSSHNTTPHMHELQLDPWTHALWLPSSAGGGTEFWIHRVRDPVAPQDAATKSYVDALVDYLEGLLHDPVTLAADAQVLLNLSTQEIGLVAQAANLIFAGPASGGAADPDFRALVEADLPAHASRHGIDQPDSLEEVDVAVNKLYIGGNTTADILFKVVLGQLLVREGDDSALAPFQALSGHYTSYVRTPALLLDIGATLSISSGAITVTGSNHMVETEGGAASDDLTNINGYNADQFLILHPVNDAHSIVIKHDAGGGNISCVGQADITLAAVEDTAILSYSLAYGKWFCLGSRMAAHEAAADPHTGYVKESDADWIDLTDAGETALHSHAGGNGGDNHAPVGALYPGVLSTGLKSPQVPYLGDGFTATKFYCRASVVPAGAAITVQLKRGVGEGVSANLGAVATIAIGNHASNVVVLNQAIASGDFFEINITQTGTNPNEGSDLVWLVAP